MLLNACHTTTNRYLDKVKNRVAESKEGVCHYYDSQIKPFISGADLAINIEDDDF